MKRIMTTAAILAMVSGMAMATGDTNGATKTSQIQITQTAEMGVYHLRYAAELPGQVTVRIADKKGNVLLKEKIAFESSFDRPYNFQDLPDGSYSFSVRRDSETIEETIQHVHKGSSWKSAYDVEVNQVANSKYKLVVRKDGHDPIKVKIADKNGIIFYEGDIDESGSFSKVFDLSRATGDHMKMEITMGGKTMIRNL